MTLKKSKNSIIDLNIYYKIGAIISLIAIAYISFRSYHIDNSLLSITTIPLLLGVIIENRRLSSDWKTIIQKIVLAFGLSLIAFLFDNSGKNNSFESQIEIWPYYFIFCFVLLSVASHENKIIAQLDESITLLQSISIIYWIIDYKLINFSNLFYIALMSIGIAFCAFSFFHSFSYKKITPRTKLLLSIWSSIIMLIFAIDHIYRVFVFSAFTDYNLFDVALNFFQYFLVGVSLMYILQNIKMLIPYLPGGDVVFDKELRKEIRDMNNTHIKRYSNHQINITDSLIILMFSTAIILLNINFKIMPRHTLIWLIFWIFPFLVWIKLKISNLIRTTTKNA